MLLDWITYFLSERTQCMRIGSSLSSYCKVLSEVPQGSVLGSVLGLFVIFVNDIADCAAHSICVKMFADDTKVYTIISDECSSDRVQSSLDYICSWSDHWHLKLSPSKCTLMHMNSSRVNSAGFPDVKYNVCGSSLPSVSTVADLGVRQ